MSYDEDEYDHWVGGFGTRYKSLKQENWETNDYGEKIRPNNLIEYDHDWKKKEDAKYEEEESDRLRREQEDAAEAAKKKNTKSYRSNWYDQPEPIHIWVERMDRMGRRRE